MSWQLRWAPLWVLLVALIAYANALPGAFLLEDVAVIREIAAPDPAVGVVDLFSIADDGRQPGQGT